MRRYLQGTERLYIYIFEILHHGHQGITSLALEVTLPKSFHTSSPRYPQGNGMIERDMKTDKRIIKQKQSVPSSDRAVPDTNSYNSIDIDEIYRDQGYRLGAGPNQRRKRETQVRILLQSQSLCSSNA